MGTLREQIKNELSKINVSNIIIIDWGCGGRKVERYIHHENCEIISIDKRKDRLPTLLADMCKPLTIKEADMAFCIEVLEHLYNPDIALDNIYNNLKANGRLFIAAPFIYGIHGIHGGGRDYWRFTELGLTTLLERHNFKVLRVVKHEDGGMVSHFAEAISKKI